MDYLGKRHWWVISSIKVGMHEQQCSLSHTEQVLVFIDLGPDSEDSKLNVNIYELGQLHN